MSGWLKAYYGISSGCTVCATVFIVISIVTPAWEVITYDKDKVFQAAAKDSSVTVAYQDSGFFTVQRTHTISTESDREEYDVLYNATTYVTKEYVPLTVLAGLWQACDTLDDSTREALKQNEGSKLPKKCKDYLDVDETKIRDYPYLDMLRGLTKSADSCAIVALIAVAISILLGTFAACRQQIVFAMITGVCFFAAGIYILFTVMLMYLRKSDILRDTEGIDEVMHDARTVGAGWSMHLGWVSFIFAFCSGVSWCLMSVELKKTRMNFMYSSNYDQICSM